MEEEEREDRKQQYIGKVLGNCSDLRNLAG